MYSRSMDMPRSIDAPMRAIFIMITFYMIRKNF